MSWLSLILGVGFLIWGAHLSDRVFHDSVPVRSWPLLLGGVLVNWTWFPVALLFFGLAFWALVDKDPLMTPRKRAFTVVVTVLGAAVSLWRTFWW